MELYIGNKFRLGNRIAGGFSEVVYSGTDILTNEKVMVKLEYVRTEQPQLLNESKMYTLLQGGTGLPSMRWSGVERNVNVLVMSLLGPSLEKLFDNCGRKFSLKTVLMLADQMISLLEYIHSKSILHCNIKPDNFHMGLHEQSTQIYITGFGLSKLYIDLSTGRHIPYNYRASEYSRKEDMRSLGLILMYFLRGSLPWKDLEDRTKHEKFLSKLEKNALISIPKLCHGYPIEFAWYFHHCRALPFEDSPNYDYLRRIFRDLFIQKGFQYDYKFDWLQSHVYEDGKGTKHIQVARRSSAPINVPGKHEHQNQQGIEYIQEKKKSPFSVILQTLDYENEEGTEHHQGTEYIREKTKSRENKDGQGRKHIQEANRSSTASDHNSLEKHEYKNQQGTEYIREKKKSPFVVMQTHENENRQGKQGTEYIREKNKSPVIVTQTHEYVNEQGIEHIRPPSRSPYPVPENHESEN